MPELARLNRVRAPGSQGIKIFGGRCANPVTLGGAGTSNYETAMELDARNAKAVGSVAPIFAATGGGSEQGIFAYVNLVAAFSDLDSAWGGSNAAFWDAAFATRFPVSPSATRRSFVTADQTPLTPPARSDGRTKPLAVCRSFHGPTTFNLIGNGADSFTNWATRPAGQVRFRANSGTGDQSTATTGWSAGSVATCLGFSYSHLGPIANVMLWADSIGEGRGTYLEEGFALLAIDAINAGNPQTWLAYSNLGWSGASLGVISDGIADVLDAGIIPDIGILPCGTINSVTPGQPVTTAIVDAWRTRLILNLGRLATAEVCPIIYSIPPVDNVAAGGSWDLGTSDALRVAYNAEIKALCAACGILFVDIDATAYTGATVGGQVQIAVGATTDHTHPNDAGNAIIAPYVRAALETALGGYL